MATGSTTRLFRLVASLALCLAVAPSAWALRHLAAGDPIPAFTVATPDGAKLTKKTFAGKPFVIVFVRPGQAESSRALEAVGAMLTERAATPLGAIVIPTTDDPADAVGLFVREHELPLTVARDPKRTMYGDFGIIVSPTILFVDAAGALRFHVPHLPPGYTRRLGAHADLLLGTIDRAEHDKQVSNDPDGPTDKERSVAARLRFARILVRHGKDDQARQILDGLDPMRGGSPEAASLLATLLLRQGDTDRAAALLARVKSSETDGADVHLALARLAVAEGRADMAEKHLEAAAADGPSRDRSEILRALGALYETKQASAKALHCYRAALKDLLEPGDN